MRNLFCIAIMMVVVLAAGCAPTIPATFESSGSTLTGPILALATERGLVVAATRDGLYTRSGQQEWMPLQAPGLPDPGQVTCLALLDGELFVGTRGSGLHILSGQTWEVKNARYGGLPDDKVLSLAVDREGEGLPGTLVWVGTGKGLALRRDGTWAVFRSGKKWLWDLVGGERKRGGKAYLTSGFRIGDPDEKDPGFKAPVRSIGVGRDRVVLGGDARLAILTADRYAAVFLDQGYLVNTIRVEDGTLWCGTTKGLIWGGLLGVAEGEPYPSWRPPLGMRGVLFGGVDTRPFHYNLRQFGFNLAEVRGLARDGEGGLWVAFRGGASSLSESVASRDGNEKETRTTTVRRYGNVDEYILSSERPHYEVYGKPQGVGGDPTALVYGDAQSGVWLGTTRGIVNLK